MFSLPMVADGIVIDAADVHFHDGPWAASSDSMQRHRLPKVGGSESWSTQRWAPGSFSMDASVTFCFISHCKKVVMLQSAVKLSPTYNLNRAIVHVTKVNAHLLGAPAGDPED
jgi:hypothetical protein